MIPVRMCRKLFYYCNALQIILLWKYIANHFTEVMNYK